MDINFHYFAVKTIALHAGYSDEEADKIAVYSQYVDDFADDEAFCYAGCLPSYAAMLEEKEGYVKPVKTAITPFKSCFESEQRSVVIPFHFIPPEPLSTAGNQYVTVPATWGGARPQMITKMLQGLQARSGHPAFLMFLGMLLHIFADTYAHQSFSGFENAINRGRVDSAVEYTAQGRISKTYPLYDTLPSIGHARLGTAPDETALEYICYRDDGAGHVAPEPLRRNREVFLACAEEIFKILCCMRGRNPPSRQEVDALTATLTIGFLMPYPSQVTELAEHWHTVTGASYAYNARDVHLGFFLISEDRLPSGINAARAWQLVHSQGREAEDGLSIRRDWERLAVSGALRPADAFYYYNTCAFEIRRCVNL